MHPTEPVTSARRNPRGGYARPLGAPRHLAELALAGPTGAPARRAATNVALTAGAALLAASGLIHLYLWADGYRNIATIGPLFLVQGIVGLILAVLLVAFPRVVTAAAGSGYLLATIAAFALSASGGLFGFQDTLDAPWATNALLVEIAGLALLIAGGALPIGARSSS
jgi:hypothetical protein